MLVLYGCDYAFTKALADYEHMDFVIEKFNALNPGIHMMYSTPQRYVEALKKGADMRYSIHRDDSFPYNQNPNEFWSGFYSTRPYLKKILRQTSSRFHSSLTHSAQAILRNSTISEKLLKLQAKILDNLEVVQHHDAITGTST